jgi:hypothetical protein
MNETLTAFDVCLGWETFATLTGDLESTPDLGYDFS